MRTLVTLPEMADRLTYGSRLLGLDLGTKTIGLAIGSLPTGIATPLKTIRRTKFQQDARELLAITEKESIAGLVLGLPLNMDDTEGPRAQSTRAFVRNLGLLSPLPVLLWDERLSSFEAEDMMRTAGIDHKRRAEMIDAAAAQVILQGALDALLDHFDRMPSDTPD
ncbi:MAG: Holliday junction resolvase RuvX [Beijerinckiaceae bacterium]